METYVAIFVMMSVKMQAGNFLRPSSHEITDIRDVLQGMSWSQEVRLERQLFPSYFLDCLGFQWHSQINSGSSLHSKVYWFLSWIKIYDFSSQHPSLCPTFTSHIDSMIDKQFFSLQSRMEIAPYKVDCCDFHRLEDLYVYVLLSEINELQNWCYQIHVHELWSAWIN